MYEIYLVTNKINNKMYVGQTSIGYLNRYSQHIKESNNTNMDTYNTVFKKAIRKYGVKNFKIELIDVCENKKWANELEIYYIKYLNTYIGYQNSNGYNSTIGGDGVVINGYSIYCIDFDGNIIKEFKSINEAERIHGRGIFECCNENYNGITANGYVWCYKNKYDSMSLQEQYDYISLKINKIVRFDVNGNVIDFWNSFKEIEEILNLQESNLSKAVSKQRRLCGEYIWTTYSEYIKLRENKNKPFLKAKITRSLKVAQYDLNNNLIKTHNSIVDALIFLNKSIKDGHISQVCKGKRESAYGYKWKYLSK